jgi:hypothetical protein
MKKIHCFIFITLAAVGYSQSVTNTSYKNQAGEKVLRFETIVPLDLKSTWQLFSVDSQLQKWIAPVAHVELKTGGFILTNYDSSKTLTDDSSIKLPIVNFIENEMITLKVNLNGIFEKSVRDSDGNLQEIIQFKRMDNKHTKIISSMVGFGNGADWDKAYNFFSKGNDWTYNELLKIFK